MKILSLAQIDLSQSDARVVHLLDLARGFRQNGVTTDVVVISAKSPIVREPGLTVYVLPSWLTVSWIEIIIANLFAWFILLVKSRSYDRIYIRHHSNLALALRFAPRRTPLWLEINGLFRDEESFRPPSGLGRLRIWLGTRLERLAFRSAHRLFCVTPQLSAKVAELYGVPPDRITTISNGVDTEQYYPRDKKACRRELGLAEDACYIGFIGNFIGWAGIDTLLESLPPVLKEFPQVRVLLVGGGEKFAQYTAQADNLGIRDSVRFVGPVPKEKAPLWINAFDIGVALTAPKRHGLSPIKLYAYMACGVPVLGTDLTGFEPVREYQTGLLVSYQNVAGIRASLDQLIRDDKLRTVLGAHGRQCAESFFSWKIIAKKIISAD